MATRLFFANATAGFTPTNIRGTWNTTTSAIVKQLATAPAGTATTRGQAKGVSTNPGNVLWGRWVSDPIAKSGNLSGICNWCVGVVESTSTANAFFRLHIYVTAGSTDTVRGTLLTNFTGTTEYGTSAAGLGHHDQTISTVAVTAGDRIVVEIGYQGQTTSTTVTSTMNYGSTGITGIRIGGTAVTTQPGWIQFSDPENVIPGDFGSLRRNYCINPAAGVDLSYWAIGTNATLSRLTSGMTGFSRTTGFRATLNSGTDPVVNSPRQVASAGETWVSYIEYRGNNNRAGDVYMGYLDATGAFIDFIDEPVTYASTTFSTWFDPYTAPANTIEMLLSIETTAGAAGDTLDVSCVYYDKQSFVDYRDGSFPNWVWEGATDLSVSHSSLPYPPVGSFMPFFMH